MSDLQPGKYVVTVTDHGIVKLNEKPWAKLMFSNGAVWYGSLSDKAAPYTTKNLVTAGFSGTKLEQLNIDGAIDPSHKVEIVMDNEDYEKNGETKTVLKVKWINKVAEKMSDADLAVTLGGLNVDSMLAEARNDLGVKGEVVVKKSPLLGAEVTTEDIPF